MSRIELNHKELRTETDIISSWEDNKVKASIVCTAFNHEKFIEASIISFLIQETDFPFEILIHDDASTDSTVEIIDFYHSHYPKIIKTIKQEKNKYSESPGFPIISSIKNSLGKYILICEGDDYWADSKKIQKQVDFLEANPQYVITYAAKKSIDTIGNPLVRSQGKSLDYSSNELALAPDINTLTVCFRKDFDELPSEFLVSPIGDKFLWSFLASFGHGKFLNDILPSVYRVHDGGVFSKKSSLKKKLMMANTFYLLFMYHSRVGNNVTALHFKSKMLDIHLSLNGKKHLFYYILAKICSKLFG